jgi:surfactin synthase thioesterase subunit
VEGWKQVSNFNFKFETIPGTHYFFINPPAEFFGIIEEFAKAEDVKLDDKDEKCALM